MSEGQLDPVKPVGIKSQSINRKSSLIAPPLLHLWYCSVRRITVSFQVFENFYVFHEAVKLLHSHRRVYLQRAPTLPHFKCEPKKSLSWDCESLINFKTTSFSFKNLYLPSCVILFGRLKLLAGKKCLQYYLDNRQLWLQQERYWGAVKPGLIKIWICQNLGFSEDYFGRTNRF